MASSIAKVGPTYGRRMMKGYLSAQGIRIGEKRIGASLQRVDPSRHYTRQQQMHRVTNPVPYRAEYFGEKLHIDQNEKLVMFGATHVCAIDGYSGRIVGFVSMPIKSNQIIYQHLYLYVNSEKLYQNSSFEPFLIDRTIVKEFGLWDQLRVDMGTEWLLMLFVNEKLAHFRNRNDKPPHLSSSSKKNHIIERIWVEINQRVNYPIKSTLIEMTENSSLINIDDPATMYCVSWFTLQVANVGIHRFIDAWNNHPIPNKKGRLPRGVPNQLMASNNRTSRISANILPSLEEAVFEYCQNGGRLTDPHTFGLDPLCLYPEKK